MVRIRVGTKSDITRHNEEIDNCNNNNNNKQRFTSSKKRWRGIETEEIERKESSSQDEGERTKRICGRRRRRVVAAHAVDTHAVAARTELRTGLGLGEERRTPWHAGA
jgi:hypothetical protein